MYLNYLLFISILFLLGCTKNDSQTSKILVSEKDSLLIINTIKADSSLFDKNVVKYDKLPFMVSLYSDSLFIIDRFYFKNRNQIFNYYLIKNNVSSEVISFNSLNNYVDTLSIMKSSKIENLEKKINKIHYLLNDKFKTDFTINQILNNNNGFEKITSFNSFYFNSLKEKILKMGMSELGYEEKIRELENKLNKPFNNIYSVNGFFIMIDASQTKIKINFYFEEYVSKQYHL